MTPEAAETIRHLDELKTMVREAIDESFQNREDGWLWVAGVGPCIPPSEISDAAFSARSAVAAGVMRTISLWIRTRAPKD